MSYGRLRPARHPPEATAACGSGREERFEWEDLDAGFRRASETANHRDQRVGRELGKGDVLGGAVIATIKDKVTVQVMREGAAPAMRYMAEGEELYTEDLTVSEAGESTMYFGTVRAGRE